MNIRYMCLISLNNYKINKWYKIEKDLELNKIGFHCAKNILDSIWHLSTKTIARIEVKGKHIIDNDNECWQEMRIIKKYELDYHKICHIAIHASEKVLSIFEKNPFNEIDPQKILEMAIKLQNNEIREVDICDEVREIDRKNNIINAISYAVDSLLNLIHTMQPIAQEHYLSNTLTLVGLALYNVDHNLYDKFKKDMHNYILKLINKSKKKGVI